MKEKSVPTPLPLPLPPLETRIVHLLTSRRTLHTAISSPCSSLSLLSTSPSSPSSSSSIPFSWEHEPGIPKNPIPNFQTLSLPLPLPLPPSRHTSTSTSSPSPRSKSGTRTKPKFDPFSTALSECAKEGFEYLPLSRTGTNIRRNGTVVVPAMSSRLGLLDLYGCKAAISVVDAVVSMPRPVRQHGMYRLVKRQTGTEKRL